MTVLNDDSGPVLIVAPHPDDEVLGCGGTIARLTEAGRDVHVAIVTTGARPRFSAEQVAAVRAEAAVSHRMLGVTQTHWLDLPAAELDRLPHADLNAAIARIFAAVRPGTAFVPFVGDVHLDHQLVFRSCLVVARPRDDAAPARLLAYETLSETNWGAPGIDPAFAPTVFIDIADTLERKLAAFAAFASQCRDFPDERSPEAIRALAVLRGATVHRRAAEAFILVRAIW
ncbi:PIG-L family deacetylase [Sphingomonas sp. SUN019]|uniref:PIG-L deacetylase family protein n=1 Tax=Sphingomonas sp. SUN019 TaxID=2937788 RepID=UPI002164E378|nr:PIG-L deacetylase family protein [Sphingomonas sp. SUN019]UVO51680.1 PIG-L family deacetylase [Sphingomonas sp. SUN019]